LGPLPSVSGLTYDEAAAALDAVGVIGIEGSRSFDDSIPLDRVIRSEPQVAGAPVRPGDTVLIVISKGVDLVDIPDIIGESLNQAKKLLEAAGFSVKIDAKGIPKGFYDVAVVESYSPGQDIGA